MPRYSKTSKEYKQSCRRGISYSHEFSDSGTLATLPDTGIGADDDVVPGASPHGTGDSLAHLAASEVVGVPKEEHEKVRLELSGLRETLGKT